MNQVTRRQSLGNVSLNKQQAPHAGLWLDKFIKTQDRKEKSVRSKFVQEVAGIPTPESYKTFFNLWVEQLQRYRQGDCAMKFGKAVAHQQRIVIGTGNENVLETAVTLHRTYGVPYLPGSALKGLTASFARKYYGKDHWQKESDEYKLVFGNTDESGCVIFFDALPSYEAGKSLLRQDVLTPHHPNYYKPGSTEPPADWDDPKPVPFLSATGEYFVALAAPKGGEAWLNVVFDILKEALKELGIGAKTSSGYGRMTLTPWSNEETK